MNINEKYIDDKLVYESYIDYFIEYDYIELLNVIKEDLKKIIYDYDNYSDLEMIIYTNEKMINKMENETL